MQNCRNEEKIHTVQAQTHNVMMMLSSFATNECTRIAKRKRPVFFHRPIRFQANAFMHQFEQIQTYELHTHKIFLPDKNNYNSNMMIFVLLLLFPLSYSFGVFCCVCFFFFHHHHHHNHSCALIVSLQKKSGASLFFFIKTSTY